MKMKEINDIAMWEETDSELAKYTIGKLLKENEMLKKPIIVNWENAHKIKVKSPLQARINKAIEVLKLCNSKCAKETIDILRGEDNESN